MTVGPDTTSLDMRRGMVRTLLSFIERIYSAKCFPFFLLKDFTSPTWFSLGKLFFLWQGTFSDFPSDWLMEMSTSCFFN